MKRISPKVRRFSELNNSPRQVFVKQIRISMNRNLFLALAIAVTAPGAAIMAQNPFIGYNPGPVVSGTVDTGSLPKEAHKFIEKHFPGSAISNCEKNFYTGVTEVDLNNGTDIEFDSKGRAIEVDAGSNRALPESVVKALLPRKAYDELKRRNKADIVEGIERDSKRGYKVELRSMDETDFHFSPEGEIVMVVIDD